MLYSHLRGDGSARFYFPGSGYSRVFVTGSFCGWSVPGHGMSRVRDGWVADVDGVGPGPIEYKLIADGRWVHDPVNLRRAGSSAEANSVLHGPTSGGSAYHLRFHSPALEEERGYVVYLPAAYESGNKSFPTLYLLHGALDWERTWFDKGDIANVMDRLRAEAAIGDVIVVMPQDNGLLYRSDARGGDYLARDVVGHIDFEFRTIATADRRALDGLSTGGFTSALLGAWRPDVYRSIGSMSGSHDDRVFEAVAGCAERMRAANQRYLLSGGLEEPNVEDGRALERELRGRGVWSKWIDARGGHDWPLWRDLLEPHVRFHWENLAQ